MVDKELVILGSDAARAVGRFHPNGPLGYVARSGGPIHATRAQAEAYEAKAMRCSSCMGYGREPECPQCGRVPYERRATWREVTEGRTR